MKKLLAAIIMIGALLISGTSYAQSNGNSVVDPNAQDKQQIKQVIHASFSAMKQHKIKQQMQYWGDTPDITIIDPVSHKLLLGHRAIINYFQNVVYSMNLQLKIEKIHVIKVRDHHFAWATAIVVGKYPIRSGHIQNIAKTWAAYHLEKVNGQWKIKIVIYPYTNIGWAR